MGSGNKRGLRVISFKLDVDTLVQLDSAALKSRKYRSELIRDAIKRYLEALSERNP
ncbi:MAG: ribbon-helix-helix protein, CopG family [Acidilobus sp.]|jgi:metal-responsive CopG/Arc/MetJ family transcriptional regulator|nr:ribbon-helix-helix protein, CopG family [Acidilobus sp.]MCI4459751.1 ribbon-helix-helix protein, CopG family [Acidilobus sp.]